MSFFFYFSLQFLFIFGSFFFFLFWFSSLGFYFFLSLLCFYFLVCWRLFFFAADWFCSSLFCFLNLSCQQTCDSWRLGHVVPDGVVIADIENQAPDIFLHGPESMHKYGIGKTFTHTAIPIHPCTLLKQRAKPSTHQTWHLRLAVLSCTMWWWATVRKLGRCSSTLLQRRSPSRLGQYRQKPFADVFNK